MELISIFLVLSGTNDFINTRNFHAKTDLRKILELVQISRRTTIPLETKNLSDFIAFVFMGLEGRAAEL